MVRLSLPAELEDVMGKQRNNYNYEVLFTNSCLYVDISTDHIVGDMPVKNILRIKPNPHEKSETQEQGIVTIVCQKYMVQYRLQHAEVKEATKSKFISSVDGMGLLFYNSLLARDYTVLLGILSLVSIILMLGNLLSDFLYVVVDPRIDFSR